MKESIYVRSVLVVQTIPPLGRSRQLCRPFGNLMQFCNQKRSWTYDADAHGPAVVQIEGYNFELVIVNQNRLEAGSPACGLFRVALSQRPVVITFARNDGVPIRRNDRPCLYTKSGLA